MARVKSESRLSRLQLKQQVIQINNSTVTRVAAARVNKTDVRYNLLQHYTHCTQQ